MDGEVIDEIKLPSSLVIDKKYTAFSKMFDGVCGIRPCFEFIDEYVFIHNLYDEKNITFISVVKDITFYHYMNQPKSMLSRKLIKNFLQNQSGDYTHNWLPNCFVYNYILTDQ